MNTRNTKSIIIILLMIANIFFIYNIIMLNISTQNIPSSMIEDAVNILKNNGFSVDKSVIPAKKPVHYIYEGVYSGNFKEIVTGFSGVPEDEIQDLPTLPDEKTKYNEGGYIFIFDKSDYLKVNIMNEFHEKAKADYREIETETENEIVRLNSLTEKTQNNTASTASNQKSDIKRTEKIINNFLKKHQNYQKSKQAQKSRTQEINYDFGFEIMVLQKDSGSETEKIIINQKTDGVIINSHTAYVEIKDGEVQYFYGRWYFGTFAARYKMPLLDSVNILFKYIDREGSVSGENSRDSVKLEKMEPEYNILLHSSDEFYLMPSWVLLFGDGKKLSYDMIVGKLTNY